MIQTYLWCRLECLGQLSGILELVQTEWLKQSYCCCAYRSRSREEEKMAEPGPGPDLSAAGSGLQESWPELDSLWHLCVGAHTTGSLPWPVLCAE